MGLNDFLVSGMALCLIIVLIVFIKNLKKFSCVRTGSGFVSSARNLKNEKENQSINIFLRKERETYGSN